MLSRIVFAACLGIRLAAVATIWPEPRTEVVQVQSRAQHLAAIEAESDINLVRALIHLAAETCAPAPVPAPAPGEARARTPATQGRHDI